MVTTHSNYDTHQLFVYSQLGIIENNIRIKKWSHKIGLINKYGNDICFKCVKIWQTEPCFHTPNGNVKV